MHAYMRKLIGREAHYRVSIVGAPPSGLLMAIARTGLISVITILLLLCFGGKGSGASRGNQRHAAIRIYDRDVYPESITSAGDGAIIAGSLMRPFIYRAARNERIARRWIDLRPVGSTTYGVLADQGRSELWACTVEHALNDRQPTKLATRRTSLRLFDLLSGQARGVWPLPRAGEACNDIAVGPDGTVYVSDTGYGNRIMRLPPDRRRLDMFFSGPEAEMVDGIAVLGDKLYFSSIRTGRFYHVSLDPEEPPKPIELRLSRPLAAPDGMRGWRGGIFVAGSGAGEIVYLSLKGTEATVTTLATGLDVPTSVTVSGDRLWFAELKSRFLINMKARGRRNPFYIRSLALRPDMAAFAPVSP